MVPFHPNSTATFNRSSNNNYHLSNNHLDTNRSFLSQNERWTKPNNNCHSSNNHLGMNRSSLLQNEHRTMVCNGCHSLNNHSGMSRSSLLFSVPSLPELQEGIIKYTSFTLKLKITLCFFTKSIYTYKKAVFLNFYLG